MKRPVWLTHGEHGETPSGSDLHGLPGHGQKSGFCLKYSVKIPNGFRMSFMNLKADLNIYLADLNRDETVEIFSIQALSLLCIDVQSPNQCGCVDGNRMVCSLTDEVCQASHRDEKLRNAARGVEQHSLALVVILPSVPFSREATLLD